MTNNRMIKVPTRLIPDDHAKLMQMAADDGVSRSVFIGHLIRAEWVRRYSKPNPTVTVGAAVAAGAALTGVPETADAHDTSVPATGDNA